MTGAVGEAGSPRRRAAIVLIAALAGISIAAPLVRLSDAHPLAIATWRLGITLPAVGVAIAITGGWREWRTLTRRELLLALGAGVALALHFWSWNASLGLTSIAASVVLVNLQPAVVACLSAVWLAERPSRRAVAGIALAIAGGALVAFAGDNVGPRGGRPLLGNTLALAGAITAACYYVAGRRLRQQLALWPYVALVYSACFVTLLALCFAVRAPLWQQPPREIGIFALLAAGPMLLGHTGMNWALKHLPAYVVNLTVLGEPVGATLLAALLPGIREIPSLRTLAGGIAVLGGALLASSRSPREASDTGRRLSSG